MKRLNKGFTLIEVALFLVITGALFASIAVGVQNSISQQRINDSVQSFADFLRGVYSGVANTESTGNGRSETAIYGKLVTFGENATLTEDPSSSVQESNRVYVYDVIGRIGDVGTGNVLNTLNELNANVIMPGKNGIPRPVGVIQSFVPKWTSSIEPPCNGDICEYVPFVGALLIVHHPSSGNIYTFVMKDKTIDVNSKIKAVDDKYQAALADKQAATTDQEKAAAEELIDGIITGKTENILREYLNADSFKINEQVDFCINPEGNLPSYVRRDVRIISGARNSSGVEIVSDSDSRCTN